MKPLLLTTIALVGLSSANCVSIAQAPAQPRAQLPAQPVAGQGEIGDRAVKAAPECFVLAKNGMECLAVQFTGRVGDKYKYRWFLQSDGSMDFSKDNVQQGEVELFEKHEGNRPIGNTVIKQGTFNLEWSMAGPTAGWFYYSGNGQGKVQLAIVGPIDPKDIKGQQATWNSEKVSIVTVTKVEPVTEISGGGAWQKAGAGTGLAINDRFRTGPGSKAELKFTDGSLLRLGQLSMVEIRSAKGVAVLGGHLLFSMLRPGRVLAGTGAAEIKGSVGIIELMDDGSADFTLYSGAMDVVTPQNTVSVPPGRSVTVRPDGTLSEIQLAKPIPKEIELS